jgi:hypothetical protein
LKGLFNSDGGLKPEAGQISWPFQNSLCSNLAQPIKERLQSTIESWTNESRTIINNAFIYACMQGKQEAAELLLAKGADISAIPAGFHYPGTALHKAAGSGQLAMVKFLIHRGASPRVKDVENEATPASWAAYGGHTEVKEYLEGLNH